jgi:hypothetical protein
MRICRNKLDRFLCRNKRVEKEAAALDLSYY